MVDKNSVVDRNSEKLVDEISVVVQNTGLQPEELDEEAVVAQSVFSHKICMNEHGQVFYIVLWSCIF